MIIELVLIASLATSYPNYSFEALVSESTVVVSGNVVGAESGRNHLPYLEQYDVISGSVLNGQGRSTISLGSLPYSNPVRPGRGLYFLVQCDDSFFIAGYGQGAFGLVGNGFMIQTSQEEVARVLTKSEVTSEVESLDSLGVEAGRVCNSLGVR